MKKDIAQGIVGGFVSLYLLIVTIWSFMNGNWLWGIGYFIVFLFWYNSK